MSRGHRTYLRQRLSKWVQLRGLTRNSFDHNKQLPPPGKWCEERWGEPLLVLKPERYSHTGFAWHRQPEGKWALFAGRYYFRDMDQAIMFKLTWG